MGSAHPSRHPVIDRREGADRSRRASVGTAAASDGTAEQQPDITSAVQKLLRLTHEETGTVSRREDSSDPFYTTELLQE
jgi:hypothetical protein